MPPSSVNQNFGVLSLALLFGPSYGYVWSTVFVTLDYM